jgi:hypothetical protein
MRSLAATTSLVFALWLGAALAPAAPRTLPMLTLADETGTALTEASLLQSANWVLLVVDAEKHLTTAVLPRFQKKDGGWAGRLVVVAAGPEAAFRRMVGQNAKLEGVRWSRDTSGRLMQQLGLSGTPVLLGIGPDNVIAWQLAAVPEAPEKVQALVSQWLDSPAAGPQGPPSQ